MNKIRTSNYIRSGLKSIGSFIVIVFVATGAFGAEALKFYSDDPLWVYPDTQDAAGVQPWDIYFIYDAVENTFYRPGDKTKNVRALDINTVDEVPDSSWFTNRAGMKPLTVEEVAKGPNTTNGPAPGKWTVIASKSEGVSPGFTIKDSAGIVWFIKFDGPDYPTMATGIEVTSTKLFWALGYNVPEDHIAVLRFEDLEIGEGATIKTIEGKKRQVKSSDIEDMLKLVSKNPDGSYRVHASKALDGKILGGILMYGTRPDDPNDIYAHEHRRVLRGYGTFAAWFNHVDSKSINAKDTLITENGKSFVRHYLLDFSSTVGSGTAPGWARVRAGAPQDWWEGFEYELEDFGTIGKGIPTFGFYILPWRTWPFFVSPAAGRVALKAEEWDPDSWRPKYSNAAFLHARPDDKFWAAQKAMGVTDDMIRAAVKEGQFADPESEEAITTFLIERRNTIGRKYLTQINPIVDPALDSSGKLTFGNAAVSAGFANVPESYQATWYTFDNATRNAEKIGETVSSATSMQVPSGLPTGSDSYIKVEISATSGENPSWATPVHAYFRLADGGWKLVGFERMPEGSPAFSYVKK